MTDDRIPRTALGRVASGLGKLATALLVSLGFVVCSSFAAELSSSHAVRLLVGLAGSLALPLLFGLWSRGRARARGGRGAPVLAVIALFNVIILVGATLVAPAQTRRAVDRHGAWWMAVLCSDPHSRLVEGTQSVLSWLAGKLPRTVEGGSTAVTPTPVSRETGAKSTPIGTLSRRDGERARPDAGAVRVAGSEVRVAFQKREGAVLVPVRLAGSGGAIVEARMLFDTGASLTTLDEATLRKLGVSVDPDNPTVEMRTANGLVRRPLVIVEAVSVGAARVTGGITVAVCEPCAQGDVVGLLGLNVSGCFRVTLDHDASQLVLQPKADRSRLDDIRPWVELEEARGSWRGPLLTVDLTVENRAPRALRNLRVAAVVSAGGQEGKVFGELAGLAARGRAPLRLQGLPAVRGASFRLRLEQADW